MNPCLSCRHENPAHAKFCLSHTPKYLAASAL